MAAPTSSRLTTVAARATPKCSVARNFGTRRLRHEFSIDDKCHAEHCESSELAIENHAKAALTQAVGLISAAASNASSARVE